MRNLKKVIALVAVFAMMVSTVAFAQSFGDVADGDNYYEAIETLNKLGVLTGDDENNDGVMEFRPADSITRAEIAVIVARIKGQTGAVAQTNTVFTDVPSTHWASGYIAQATNQGIVNGYGDGTFGPDDKVLYQDVVKMLMETLGYKPYAQENGGYPTGYLLAAQQQEVLKGVVGGAEGQEATRGQVAQMTYNAIDTPLMDRYVYGTGQGQYVVWDGDAWSPRKTLMNQYLGIQKLRGLVTANDVTELTSIGSIDTSVDSKIRLYIEDNYLGTNDSTNDYELEETVDLYVGDTSANDYLGYDVVVYVKDNKNDTDTVLSITEATGRNTKQSFTLSQYDSLDLNNTNDYLCYMKNDTDRSATKIKLQNSSNRNGIGSPVIILNGRYFEGDVDDLFDKVIVKDTTLSGEVVTLDNDTENGVDVIFVNIASGMVVDEVSARGTATFKNECVQISGSASIRFTKIEFNSSDSNVKVNITKDGQPFDYTQLKAKDVLSVVARTDNGEDYFDIEVLGADTAVVGTVTRSVLSDTSDTGYSYTINGTDYDVAEGADNTSSIKAGTAGTFYIDKYGKIVAYDKTAAGNAPVTADNYGYVIKAAANSTGFDNNVPQLQILYKDGTVGVWDFASTVNVDNPTDAVMVYADDTSDASTATIKYKDHEDNAEDIARAFAGQVITFNGTNGQIKNITMAVKDSSSNEYESSLTLIAYGNNSDYDEDVQQFKITGAGTRATVDVTEDTLIFYIGKQGGSFGFEEDGAKLDIDDCTIGTGAGLREQVGSTVAAYTNSGDTAVADVLVIYNRNPGQSPSSPIAYVSSIGTTKVDGTNVLSIRYYEGGELKEAVTDGTTVGDLNGSTVEGSAFKFTFAADGETITDATAYVTFNGTVRDQLTANDDVQKNGLPNLDYVKVPGANDDEEVYFGAVVKKQSGRLTIAPMVPGELPDPAEIFPVSLSNVDTNYYTYDPTRNSSAKFGVGALGDITAEKTLTANGCDDSYVKDITVNLSRGTATGSTPAWGMLDYVFIRKYEKTADVIDYMAWEYDYSID